MHRPLNVLGSDVQHASHETNAAQKLPPRRDRALRNSELHEYEVKVEPSHVPPKGVRLRSPDTCGIRPDQIEPGC